ncbi:LSU ribosomal protein L22P [Caldanaerobius fijiensis DSM 17918]|uniref:Large ribosomal subunit protein uL22 n=1 Tax=Caldanaerobius fijiensis DSM 17918 TaxID=1121256 RepID=A0A1M4YUS9_9THEO|nr:50S ribosomal protein L22 [Caldanaerobius fijiensis]SHF09520.1 LSU ribosomal protein L22P [Caldanaerobius fijiensis DSM 17918]
MEARATARYLRLSPLKARLVVDMIRGKSVREAMAILNYTPNKAAYYLRKVLKSAVANAENNFNMNADNLYVAEVFANPGPIMKRYKPRARGRADVMRRRTSHLTVVVKER